MPCGIADATVTSLSRELGRRMPAADLLPLLEARLPALSIGTGQALVPST